MNLNKLKEDSLKQLELFLNKIKIVYPDLLKIKKISIGGKYTKRIFCELHFLDGTKKHTQVARVLLEASLGRVLDRKETVDHIDGNALNNSLDNLQMLSLSENAKKGPTDEVKLISHIKSGIKSSGFYKGHGKKLSKTDVENIRMSLLSARDLGKMYSVGHTTILNIKNNKIWKI